MKSDRKIESNFIMKIEDLNIDLIIGILIRYGANQINNIDKIRFDKSVDDSDIIVVEYDTYHPFLSILETNVNYIKVDDYKNEITENRNKKINNLLNE